MSESPAAPQQTLFEPLMVFLGWQVSISASVTGEVFSVTAIFAMLWCCCCIDHSITEKHIQDVSHQGLFSRPSYSSFPFLHLSPLFTSFFLLSPFIPIRFWKQQCDSSVCISTMSERHSNCPGMTWHEMDMRPLSFPDVSFDVVLEKATLDPIMVQGKTPFEVSPQTACFIHKILTEVLLKICDKGWTFLDLWDDGTFSINMLVSQKCHNNSSVTAKYWRPAFRYHYYSDIRL